MGADTASDTQTNERQQPTAQPRRHHNRTHAHTRTNMRTTSRCAAWAGMMTMAMALMAIAAAATAAAAAAPLPFPPRSSSPPYAVETPGEQPHGHWINVRGHTHEQHTRIQGRMEMDGGCFGRIGSITPRRALPSGAARFVDRTARPHRCCHRSCSLARSVPLTLSMSSACRSTRAGRLDCRAAGDHRHASARLDQHQRR